MKVAGDKHPIRADTEKFSARVTFVGPPASAVKCFRNLALLAAKTKQKQIPVGMFHIEEIRRGLLENDGVAGMLQQQLVALARQDKLAAVGRSKRSGSNQQRLQSCQSL